jgi:hypothetical protein
MQKTKIFYVAMALGLASAALYWSVGPSKILRGEDVGFKVISDGSSVGAGDGVGRPASSTGIHDSSHFATATATSPDDSKKSRVVKGVSWGKYPGTLSDQVDRAISNRDGPMAADLAAVVRECDSLKRKHEDASVSNRTPLSESPNVLKVRAERIQEEQRNFAGCQTIGGNWKEIRTKLLETAFAGKVEGAASELFVLGVNRGEVVELLIADATAGHLQSLVLVSGNGSILPGLNESRQLQLRLGLMIAAQDPDVGDSVRPYLEMAQTLGRAMNAADFPKLDSFQAGDANLTGAQEVAARIVAAGKRRK